VRLTFSCELLSESYLCIIVHNRFYFSIKRQRLWIAFRIVSLHYRSQHSNRGKKHRHSCELLSESYLCIIVHNFCKQIMKGRIVVNCFQNRIFALSFTTLSELNGDYYKLWIAFRIVSLHYRSQHQLIDNPITFVVNCFQNRIFALSFTTCIIDYGLLHKLWIAFRIVSLHYRLQPTHRRDGHKYSCELLSESYLCIIVYNWRREHISHSLVVNCFQNRIFALSFTTWPVDTSLPPALWIAFRIVSLHYRLQQVIAVNVSRCSCELLSESYLCIIVYNICQL